MEGEELIFRIFSEFMTKIAKLEELVNLGSGLLVGFHHGLEFIRRPPINKTSDLIEHIFGANDTKRLLTYVEAGCVTAHDSVENISKLHTCQLGLYGHLSKAKLIVDELEGLVKKVTSAMLTLNEIEPHFLNKVAQDELAMEVITNEEEGVSSVIQKPRVTHYAAMMSVIYCMVKKDFIMQEKVISSLNFKSSSGELESYSLMWSLRPYINEEIMQQAWRLIP